MTRGNQFASASLTPCGVGLKARKPALFLKLGSQDAENVSGCHSEKLAAAGGEESLKGIPLHNQVSIDQPDLPAGGGIRQGERDAVLVGAVAPAGQNVGAFTNFLRYFFHAEDFHAHFFPPWLVTALVS